MSALLFYLRAKLQYFIGTARTILARWLALQRLRISARNSARSAYRFVTTAFMNLISNN
jgi:hypothetical protein